MNHVASLELCRELYELSGWCETGLLWCSNQRDRRKKVSDAYVETYAMLDKIKDVHGEWPTQLWDAYDLGYLLRKLQDNDLTVVLRWNRDMGGRIAMKEWDGKYCIGTFDMPQGEYPIADTPEDAAATLAIQLFKQGVLVREIT
ncbi:hypothetical protein RhoFasB10_03304 [Rhodococcus sp. B10]|nr:hypothetical protein [Rhodococcus sp. B10]